jgi:CRISPR/Cas system endoribonuclease Cas6 (RAMP superfamily)
VASQQRYSSRQCQSMRMEGFVDRVTYAGDLTPFLVLLKLGELIHVGKGAVFGLGQMRIVG